MGRGNVKIVIDYIVGISGRVEGVLFIETTDAPTAAMLTDLAANPGKRGLAGYDDVCAYPGAPVGLTRWHHIQAAGAAPGAPAVSPASPPLLGESLADYEARVKQGGSI